jgi:hypothetical protein
LQQHWSRLIARSISGRADACLLELDIMMQRFSSLRARLASFEHAYAVATRLHLLTGRDQFVILTGNPLQPVRVTEILPTATDCVMARVL